MTERELNDLLDALSYLDNFVPPWARVVLPNLDPTFYGTGTYKGDLEVKETVDKIRKLIAKYKA